MASSMAPSVPPAVQRALAAAAAGLPLISDACAVRDGRVVAVAPLAAGALLAVPHDGPPRTKAQLSVQQPWDWRTARPAGRTPAGDSLWVAECPTARAVRHAAPGSLRVHVAPCGTVSVGEVLRDVPAGGELTRDWLHPAAPSTVSSAAAALELLQPEVWADPAGRAALHEAVAAATAAAVRAAGEPPSAPPPVARGAGRPHAPLVAPEPPVAVFTDYPLLAAAATRPDFAVTTVQDGSPLSALWLVSPFKQWDALPAGLLINQFPYEGALVRKDLLALTARKVAAAEAAAAGAAAAEGAGGSGGAGAGAAAAPPSPAAALAALFPPWCPVTFDLRTEAHLLAAFHHSAAAPPAWILKLAGGTHSSDPCITRELPCAMRYGLSAPRGDRVAQAYEPAPVLLCGGRKFDVRVYVAVRRFHPLQAAVHCGYYGRVAPAAFAPAAGEVDNTGAHFTVSWYGDGPASTLLGAPALAAAAGEAGVDWAGEAHPAIVGAITQLLRGAGRHAIGHWPGSRALYGVDVLLAWRGGGGGAGAREGGDSGGGRPPGATVQPLILEVNFAGDLQTLLQRVPAAQAGAGAGAGAPSADGGGAKPTFVDEVLGYLFTDEATPAGWEDIA